MPSSPAVGLSAPLASTVLAPAVPAPAALPAAAAAPAVFAAPAAASMPAVAPGGKSSVREISSVESSGASALFDGAGKRDWAAALALWGAVGPLTQAASAAAPHAAVHADWGVLARGAALVGPMAAAGAWNWLKRWRGSRVAALHAPVDATPRHFGVNIALGAVGIAATAIFAGSYIDAFYRSVSSHGIGFLHAIGVEGWKNTAASIVLLDFAGWWWHYACHRYPLLWRLHKVHHSDHEYDFSTAYRTHWAEMAVETLERLTMYALVGPTLATMAVYEVITVLLSQFQHANVRLPERWESLLSRLFITSHKHYIHHSMNPRDYDTNYGILFSLWDKLFGTFRAYELTGPDAEFPTGIREYPNARELGFWTLMWMPFRSAKAAEKKP